MYFKRTMQAVQRCKSEQRRCSRDRARVGRRYGDVARKLTKKYEEMHAAVDVRIEASRSNDAVREAMRINRDQIGVVTTAMDKERSIVAKFKELKCDKHMETETIVKALEDYNEEKRKDAQEKAARLAGHDAKPPPVLRLMD